MQPTRRQVHDAVLQGYNLVPVLKTLPADLETTVSVLLKLRSREQPCFLLESVEGGETIARFSFIGVKPLEVLRQTGTDPLLEAERRLKQFRWFPVQELPGFSGGFVGYLSYDCVHYYEPKVPVPETDRLGIPESILMLFESFVVFDHLHHLIRVVAHCDLLRHANEDEAYDDCLNSIESMIAKLRAQLDHQDDPVHLFSDKDEHAEDQQYYENAVKKLKQHICKGDIIQAVPSRRISSKLGASPLSVYRHLRTISPSPYMFFLDFIDFQIVGASPELLVKVEKGLVTTHPIAGTRKRGSSEKEDEELAKDLLDDPKERAEHVMLVDLGRNDIGRIAEPGTVKVDQFMKIEKFSHVMHLVSRVTGELDPSKTPFDAFRSVFPAGTVSGAPKVRAMQLISEIEQRKRGVYAGAVGYLSFSGSIDTCIAIRTMVMKDDRVYFQAGGGIVYDSDPTLEFVETENKLRAAMKSVEAASKPSSSLSPTRKRRPRDIDSLEDERASTKLQKLGERLDKLPQMFGQFGGRFVPETLVAALDELEDIYLEALKDPEFHHELRALQRNFVGRPTPLYHAERLSAENGGAQIWFKREDLCHTGAHKINNALGQALLAKKTGKTRIIAETGAGQHGVASATACALLGLDCTVYMGLEDIHRQALNVFRMKLLGAKVEPVTSGAKTLKDAINEAMRDWVTNVRTTFYLLGSAVGPHPFPTIVRDFQRIIGDEAREQFLQATGKLPDVCMACVGGGSNSIGMFHPFIEDKSVRLIGVEAAGHGVQTGLHSATIGGGTPGVLHGSRTYLLQDKNGQITETHSISAGLDYPGVGPQHSHLHASGRAEYVAVTDSEALEGLKSLSRMEGIIPALETAHAVYYAVKMAKDMRKDQHIVVCLSGRGDKDMVRVSQELGLSLENQPEGQQH